MQYPKISNNNNSWVVPEVQSVREPESMSSADPTKVSVSDADQTNLIVNYLPDDMTEDELFDIFGKIGQIYKLKIVRERNSGRSLGYGFVDFKNARAARIAQVMCDQYEIRGKLLKVAFARPRSEDILQANLYVAYLPPDVDERMLAAVFGCYGTIIEVRLLRCKFSGKSRCAGFVRFDQRVAAEGAKKALHNNYVFKDARRPISVQFAQKHLKPPMSERLSFSPIDINRETQPAANSIQNAYPLSRPIKREMEPETKFTTKRSIEPFLSPLLVKQEPKIQQRHKDPEIESPVKPSPAPNPYPWLVKRPMESDIDQITKQHYSPCPFKHHMEPKHQMDQMIQQRQMYPEIEPSVKPSQAPNHRSLLLKRPMEPEIDNIIKHKEEPYRFPLPIKRQIEPKIHTHQMEAMIQQHQIDPQVRLAVQDCQVANPYPWLAKRPMKPEIEPIAKRACGYIDPNEE